MDTEEQKNKKPYRQLIVWQMAHQFVLKIYEATETFPKQELYGLTSQLRRAAASVALNIVEGYSKQSKKDLLRFLDIAKGSCTRGGPR